MTILWKSMMKILKIHNIYTQYFKTSYSVSRDTFYFILDV